MRRPAGSTRAGAPRARSPGETGAEEERHVAAQLGGDRLPCARPEAKAAQRSSAAQRRRRVAAPAAESRAGRDALDQRESPRRPCSPRSAARRCAARSTRLRPSARERRLRPGAARRAARSRAARAQHERVGERHREDRRRSSWKPSARRGPTARPRLSLARARTRIARAGRRRLIPAVEHDATTSSHSTTAAGAGRSVSSDLRRVLALVAARAQPQVAEHAVGHERHRVEQRLGVELGHRRGPDRVERVGHERRAPRDTVSSPSSSSGVYRRSTARCVGRLRRAGVRRARGGACRAPGTARRRTCTPAATATARCPAPPGAAARRRRSRAARSRGRSGTRRAAPGA